MQRAEQHLQTIESCSHPGASGTGRNKGGLLAECCLNRVPVKSSQHPPLFGSWSPLDRVTGTKGAAGSGKPHSAWGRFKPSPALGSPHSPARRGHLPALKSCGGVRRVSLGMMPQILCAATSHRIITTKDIVGPSSHPSLWSCFTGHWNAGISSWTLCQEVPPLQLPTMIDHKALTYTSVSGKNETFPVIPKRTNQTANV